MEAIASDVFETRAQRKVPAWVAGLARTGWAVWKFVAGTLLAMHPVGAVIVAGWTNRFMQRTAFKAWWKQTERPFKKLMTFREAAAHTPGWIDHASWPNWVLSQTPVADLRRGRVHRLVLGLWNNLRIGFLAVFNTALVLLLPSLLMAVWWYAGWQVSFNKAYEYFANGALFSLTGGLLLIVVMFYVPMAQARQAVAGEARRFWQFGLVRRVIRRRWLLCTLLALGYSAAGAVVMILISIPMSPGLQDYFNSLPADRLKLYLHAYYLSAALFIFPAYVVLRWFAARIYASAIGHMLSTGEVRADELAPSERLAFPAGTDQLTCRRGRMDAPRCHRVVDTLGAVSDHLRSHCLCRMGGLRRGSLHQPVLHLPRAARLARTTRSSNSHGRTTLRLLRRSLGEFEV